MTKLKLNTYFINAKYILTISLIITSLITSCSIDDTTNTAENNLPPGEFNQNGIENNTINIDLLPTFTWSSAIDPDGDSITYRILLDQNENPTTILADGIIDTSYTVIERLNTYETYYWKIIAIDTNNNSTGTNVFNFSTRGLNFSVLEITNNAASPRRLAHKSAVFNNKIWIIGGIDENGNRKNDVWYSPDGVTWIEATAEAAFSGRCSHTSVVFNNKIWVIAGFDINDNIENDVWAFE